MGRALPSEASSLLFQPWSGVQEGGKESRLTDVLRHSENVLFFLLGPPKLQKMCDQPKCTLAQLEASTCPNRSDGDTMGGTFRK